MENVIDCGNGLQVNFSKENFFNYDDIIAWAQTKQRESYSRDIAPIRGSPTPFYLQPPTSKNALVQFLVDFGRFFENKYYEMYKKEEQAKQEYVTW